jgi:hypothetical protein
MEKKMKKKLTILAAVLGAALVFAACMSYPIKAENYTSNIVYWDENLPREESVELALFSAGLTVTSYNGIPVDWGKKPLVFLPPGPTVFTLNLTKFDTGSVIVNGSTIFAWDFKAGDRFNLHGWNRGKPGLLLWNMDVEKNFGEYDFYPFPKSEPGQTVLE